MWERGLIQGKFVDVYFYVSSNHTIILNSLKMTGRWKENQNGVIKIEVVFKIKRGMLWWMKIEDDSNWVHENNIEFYEKEVWSEIKECSNMP